MDQSTHQASNNEPLDRFVARALSELEKLRYSRRSLRRYRSIWRQFVTFSHEANLGDEVLSGFSGTVLISELPGLCLSSRNNPINATFRLVAALS
ncbi:MAG: hypothetical protein JO283_13690 [Bradyrhizobium sp.]|nr:hypothetical protein [Bradyrhizobium sp.]